ncbi:MAG TPA: amidohydrolase family protein [Myxococcaceae bacterium]|nr:amidohydrolase family protein [Myxococcaceae bacterium]
MSARSVLLAGTLALAGCAYTGKSIDAHAHLESGSSPGRIQPSVSGRPDVLLGEMDRTGVERAVLLVVPPTPDLTAMHELHDQVAAVVKAHPGRFLAVGAAQPTDGDAGLRELERIATLGYRGVKLSPSKLELQTPEVQAFVARAVALKLVVYIEGWWPGAAHETGKLALAFPQGRFVLTHMGGIRFDDVLVFRLLELYPFYPRNVWFDLSAIAPMYVDSPYAAQLRWVCRRVGTDRVMFGSDFPLNTLDAALDAVRRLGFTRQEEQAILHDNAEFLFR